MNYIFRYYSDPGILFDISKMLLIKLNPINIWSSLLTSLDTHQEDVLFIQHHAASFPDPKPELLLFSSLPSNKRTTFLSLVLSTLIQKDFCSFSINSFLSYFDNIEQVKHDIYTYYFDDELSDTIDFEYVIRNLRTVTEKVKLLLFGFYVNPEKYLNYLTQTLVTYFNHISSEFISVPPKVHIPNSFIDHLLTRINSQHISNRHPHTILYSLSFTTPEFLVFNCSNELPYLITTSKSIERLLNTTDPFSLDSFVHVANALGDKQRMLIINLLIEKENLSLTEISDALNISKTAVQHHITYLKKAKLISVIRSYRKVTYYLNSKGFSDALSAFQKLVNGEKIT